MNPTKVNFVIQGSLQSGDIFAKIGKNKAGEEAIILFSRNSASSFLDKAKLQMQKTFGGLRSGIDIAQRYSKELNLQLNNVKSDPNPTSGKSGIAERHNIALALRNLTAGDNTIKSASGEKISVHIEQA